MRSSRISCVKCGACRQSTSSSPASLLGEEAVVRLVGVEGGDHVVAVLPLAVTHDDVVGVGVEADRVGVADDVEPVAAPTLAEARRGEQPIDLAGERVWRPIGHERGDLVGRRRKSVQIERSPSQKRRACRPARRKCRFFSWSRASRKASIGVWADCFSRGVGTLARWTF